MSIFSDYKVGALSDVEFHNACVEMNARDRWKREHIDDFERFYEADQENDGERDGERDDDQDAE